MTQHLVSGLSLGALDMYWHGVRGFEGAHDDDDKWDRGDG